MPKKEIDELTPEQIAEATRVIVPSYYAYYNNSTGDILSVSNQLIDNEEFFLHIPYEIFEKFMTGQEQFKDWVVNRTKNSSNESGIEIVSRAQQSITFRNNMLEVIKETTDDNADLIVHWDQFNKKWIFILTDEARQKVYDSKVATKVLNFFITHTSKFDFLIRTIDIPLNSIMSDKVEIPFETTLENDISNINISTRHAFDSYSLKLWKFKQNENTNN